MSVVLITLASTAATTILLWVWASYNQWRYGPLRRRSIPKDVTASDLTLHFRTPEPFEERLQTGVWVDVEPGERR